MIGFLVPPKTHIFFHMGPGFHAQVELALFEHKYPHVLFVDQPHNLNFREVCNWAQNLIKEHYHRTNLKLTLLGHSFGAQIIMGAMEGVSHLIEEVRFLNSPHESLDAFISLEQALYPQAALGGAYWHGRTVDEKMHLIFKIGSDFKLNSFYWRCDKARSLFEQISVGKPALNMSSFLKIYMDYLAKPLVPYIWEGNAKIMYSKQDALIHEPKMVYSWKNLLPNAQFIAYEDGGHYLHIENEQIAESFFK